MEWTLVDEGHEYTIDLTLCGMACVGLLLTIILTTVIGFVRRSWTRVQNGPGAILLIVFLAVCLGLFIVAPVGVGLMGGFTSLLAGVRSRGVSPWALFGAVLQLELTVALLGSVAVTVALGLGARWRPPPGKRLGAVLLTLLLLGCWMISQIGASHALLIAQYTRLPRFAEQRVGWIHAGQEVAVQSKLRNAKSHHHWVVSQPAPLKGGADPQVSFEERAETNWVKITKRTTIAVKQEIGHPSFPLRVGNRWVYTKVRRSGTRVLFVFTDENEQVEEEAWSLDVTKTQVVDGVHQFWVESRVGGAPIGGNWLVAYDGQTALVGSAPFTLPASGASEPFEFPLKRGSCRGMAHVTERTPIPGPCLCAPSHSRWGDAIVAIASLGTVIPSGSESYRLARTVVGPAEAEFAPVAGGGDAAPASALSCPPADAATIQHCLESYVPSLDRQRVERLIDRLTAAGLRASLAEREVYIKGTAAQLEEQLGARITFGSEPALCPGDEVCVPTLDPDTASGRALYRLGLSRLRLNQRGGCDAL